MEVTKVGDETIYGHLAKEIQEEEPMSPLKLRLQGLAKTISKIGYVGAFLVTCSYLFSNGGLFNLCPYLIGDNYRCRGS